MAPADAPTRPARSTAGRSAAGWNDAAIRPGHRPATGRQVVTRDLEAGGDGAWCDGLDGRSPPSHRRELGQDLAHVLDRNLLRNTSANAAGSAVSGSASRPTTCACAVSALGAPIAHLGTNRTQIGGPLTGARPGTGVSPAECRRSPRGRRPTRRGPVGRGQGRRHRSDGPRHEPQRSSARAPRDRRREASLLRTAWPPRRRDGARARRRGTGTSTPAPAGGSRRTRPARPGTGPPPRRGRWRSSRAGRGQLEHRRIAVLDHDRCRRQRRQIGEQVAQLAARHRRHQVGQ